jgi:hypothetical protein
MNIYSLLRELAKTNKAQNVFLAAKEIHGIHIFKNITDLSNIQEFYLTWLYTYDMITKDIITNKISGKVLTDNMYEDAYLLWKNKRKSSEEIKSQDNPKELHLVAGKTITFPKEV